MEISQRSLRGPTASPGCVCIYIHVTSLQQDTQVPAFPGWGQCQSQPRHSTPTARARLLHAVHGVCFRGLGKEVLESYRLNNQNEAGTQGPRFLSTKALSRPWVTQHWAAFSHLSKGTACEAPAPLQDWRACCPSYGVCCLLTAPTTSLKVTLPSWGNLHPRSGLGGAQGPIPPCTTRETERPSQLQGYLEGWPWPLLRKDPSSIPGPVLGPVLPTGVPEGTSLKHGHHPEPAPQPATRPATKHFPKDQGNINMTQVVQSVTELCKDQACPSCGARLHSQRVPTPPLPAPASQPQCPHLYSGGSNQNQGWLLGFLRKQSQSAFPAEVRSYFIIGFAGHMATAETIRKPLNSTTAAEKQS